MVKDLAGLCTPILEMRQSLTSAYENRSLRISECWDFLAGVWLESKSFSDKGLGHGQRRVLLVCLNYGIRFWHFKEAVFIYKSLEDLKAAFKHLIRLEEGFEALLI
ncbi:hypothetical protein L3X38_018610 [Prunus dulcis]|uniref:Uncharacterized protein n=1 Tax=Prunus dulcis TaxID=3755 RepID=A0AAD4ZBS8_PRUDU|nr:hypothetical protein L3X38_018610 [Prunus dulcis]